MFFNARKMSDFGQIPTSLICRFTELTKTEIVVVSYLYAARNRKSGQCNPSRSAIARAVVIDRAHVGRAIEALEKKGWISEMTEGGWTLFLEPVIVAKSATESVAKCAPRAESAHVRNAQHDVAESATDPCEMRNTHKRISSEHKNEHRNEHSKNSAVAVVTDHSRLMQYHAKRIGTITDGGAQGKAIQTILKNFSVEDAIGCYDFQVSELSGKPGGWRSSVNWQTVMKFLPEWTTAGRPEVKQNGTHRTNDRAERAGFKNNLRNELKSRVESRNVQGSDAPDRNGFV